MRTRKENKMNKVLIVLNVLMLFLLLSAFSKADAPVKYTVLPVPQKSLLNDALTIGGMFPENAINTTECGVNLKKAFESGGLK
jgi:hypothetical protein